MKPLRQISNEAADRYRFTSAFRHIKPLKIRRSDVMPFTLEEVSRILQTVRPDWRPYFIVRFFTGMRTGEVHGLQMALGRLRAPPHPGARIHRAGRG